LILVCALVTLVAPAANATGGTASYNVFRCVHLPGVATYVQIDATGTITWSVERTPSAILFTNVVVHSPTLAVSSRTSCARTAGSITRKATVAQGFYADDCSSNSGLSLSFPWGLSAAPTFHCDTVKIGLNTSPYGSNTTWVQYNSGAPVSWSSKIFGAYSGNPVPPWPCLSMYIGVTIYQGTSGSDTAVFGNNEALHPLSC
jgi:hypothetical protein